MGVSVSQMVSRSPILRRRLTDVLHLLPQHHLVENLSSSLADEPVRTVNMIFSPGARSIGRGCRGLYKGTYDSSISADLSASGSTLFLDAVLKEGLGFVRTSL